MSVTTTTPRMLWLLAHVAIAGVQPEQLSQPVHKSNPRALVNRIANTTVRVRLDIIRTAHIPW